jgi:hypothetical protein
MQAMHFRYGSGTCPQRERNGPPVNQSADRKALPGRPSPAWAPLPPLPGRPHLDADHHQREAGGVRQRQDGHGDERAPPEAPQHLLRLARVHELHQVTEPLAALVLGAAAGASCAEEAKGGFEEEEEGVQNRLTEC